MKPVFIQSWTIPRKYLWSANLPKAMPQMVAMKILRFLQKKDHSARNNDAFTHCGISLISPNTLRQKYSGSLKSFMFYFYFIRKVAPSLVLFSGEWPIYIYIYIEAALSSWMVVTPCLTEKPHPDWTSVTEPSVYTMGSCSLLFSWLTSFISESILPAGHSQQCFPKFSGRNVCLGTSVSWHTCSIESSAWPIPFSIPLCHSQLHGVGCGDFWWQWRMLWPAPLHLCISPKHLKMAALYSSNLCFEPDPFRSSHMKLWTSACRVLYPAQFEQSSKWFIYRAVWLLHSHMKLLWSLHIQPCTFTTVESAP